MMSRAVAWLRNDLRITDNPVLCQASQASSCVPVVCLDPKAFGSSAAIHPKWCQKQVPKMGYNRARFLLESLGCLQRDLRSRGSDLLILYGAPEIVLPPIVGDGELVYCQEVGTEEMEAQESVKGAVQRNGGKVFELWGSQTLFDPKELPFKEEKLPEPFTAFRNAVENPKSPMNVPEPLPAPKMSPFPHACLGPNCSFPISDLNKALEELGVDSTAPTLLEGQEQTKFVGGEHAAKERLEAFVQHGLATYKQTRDCLMGDYFSSKLSPWLAVGNISPRSVYHRVVEFEEEHGESLDTYWLGFELKWRDFFRFFAKKHGASLYRLEGPAAPAKRQIAWKQDANAFERWCKGETGVPFVDANMRELAATGFMSNRGRQCVASYLTQDLALDWRWGAIWFEHCLLDHDVASNYGNWACAAGVGMRGQRINKFNMAKQAQQYDRNAVFIKNWVHEVAQLPPAKAIAPWTAQNPPENYPSPLTQPEFTVEARQFEDRRKTQDNTVSMKSGYTMDKKRPHYGRKGVFNAS